MFDSVVAKVSAVDLTAPYQVIGLICALLALYVMQSTWHDRMSQGDPPWMQGARRIAFMLLALGIAWSASYFDTHAERPVPPQFLMLVALTLMFFVRAVILYRHRNDRRMPSASQPQQKPRAF